MINSSNQTAREAILKSIRAHLGVGDSFEPRINLRGLPVVNAVVHAQTSENGAAAQSLSKVDVFKKQLEAVNGHCFIAHTELQIVHALTQIITELKGTELNPKRVAVSDASGLERLVRLVAVEVEEVTVTPSPADLFGFDIGITTAQAAIAETGTLVLDSSRERHRLISLVPPVHIAIVDAANIYSTLAETLSVLHRSGNVSPIVTFVTGPSRTADIELTLTIGVHGPQELYVIVNEGQPLVVS
ncbi:MAG TPA: lactate utilization protein [Pyrinomonadaceae bacterium]|jgi:L-lactate dehydrogenase complex protein LldG